MARSAQTHKSISFIWIVWSTLYVYLWSYPEKLEKYIATICKIRNILEELYKIYSLRNWDVFHFYSYQTLQGGNRVYYS